MRFKSDKQGGFQIFAVSGSVKRRDRQAATVQCP
jgi:hypothetical protein